VNLQNMAPNARRSLLLTLAFGTLAAGLYVVAIEPTERSLAKARVTLQKRTQTHRTMTTDLAGGDRVRKALDGSTARLEAYGNELIEPLLESTAMRAKALVDGLALGCGLVGTEYEALEPIALPIVGPAPAQQFVRCPVKISCHGSYQAAVSFVRCVEKRFPLVALEAFSVIAGSDPDLQLVTITFEWPMKKGAATVK